MNRVTLTGRLTKDPELRKTASGLSTCTFTIAVDKEMSSDKKDAAKAAGDPTADFPSCVVWRQAADYLTQYGHKGDLVEVDGRIQTRHYDGTDGRTVYVTEVSVQSVKVYGSRSSDSTRYDYGPSNGTSYRTKDIAAEIRDIELPSDPNDLPF